MKKFKTIAVNWTSNDKRTTDIVNQCCEVLVNIGVEVILAKKLSRDKQFKIPVIDDPERLVSKSDLLVAIGGDGTMLSCSRNFGYHGIPVLGINLGNLGFLADIAPEDISTSLTNIVNGNFSLEKRLFLKASLNNTKKIFFTALNEFVIHSGAIAKLIEYELFIDEVFVYRQKADGLIINSPTGSTAYSLSGGGPIIHPSVQSIALLPMFPHSLSSNPLIVSDKSNINILISGKKDKAKLSMDGQDSVKLKKGDVIKITKSERQLKLIHPKGHDFYSACRNKLGWSTSITN